MMKVSARLAGTAAALVLTLAGPSPAEAIVGPSRDGAGSAAHVVMVLNHTGGTAGFCTGIVIAPAIVMTAGHCVPQGADLRIHYPDAGKDPVMLPVAEVARHPDYRADAIKTRQRSIDLALVRLASPLPDRFAATRLGLDAPASPGARYAVTGYGVGQEGKGASSGQLRGTILQARAPFSTVLLWAEDPAKAGSGACTGDSGAPVMAEGAPAVVALVVWSAGKRGRQCGDLTQALWLGPQRAWIDGVMRGWGLGSPF